MLAPIVAMVLNLVLIVDVYSASKIISKKIDVYKNSNGVWNSKVSAELHGDYDRYVERLNSFEDYPEMGMPYLNDVRLVRGNEKDGVVWTHIYRFPINIKYYTRHNVKTGPEKSVFNFNLSPKVSGLPNKHGAEFLTGRTTVEKISGSGTDERFTVNSRTRLKLKPGLMIPQGLIRNGLRNAAENSLKVFSN